MISYLSHLRKPLNNNGEKVRAKLDYTIKPQKSQELVALDTPRCGNEYREQSAKMRRLG